MTAKPERIFPGNDEAEYLYGVARKEEMVRIFHLLLTDERGLPKSDGEWDRITAQYGKGFASSGLAYEIGCFLRPLETKNIEALTRLVILAQEGIGIRKKVLLMRREPGPNSYLPRECFNVLPHMLRHGVERIAEKLDDFELRHLQTLIFFAGGKILDEEHLKIIESLRR